MMYEQIEVVRELPQVCRYPGSRLIFRGPPADLSRPEVVCLGGAETYGRFLPVSYPERVSKALRKNVINFGVVNAGIDSFMKDPLLRQVSRKAELVVLETPGAENLSNRFYRVHPRRNDRFLGATSLMRRVFPGVDFTDFAFTGHMIQTVQERSPERFDLLIDELQKAWVARMLSFLDEIGPHVELLWLSQREMTGDHMMAPHFVTADMVDKLRPALRGVTEVVVSKKEVDEGQQTMVVSRGHEAAAKCMLGPLAQMRAATAVMSLLERNENGGL